MPPLSTLRVLSAFLASHPGGVKDHDFLATRVNQNIIYIFGILASRAIDWYINESILRGPGGGESRGGSDFFGGVSRLLLGHFHKFNTFLKS